MEFAAIAEWQWALWPRGLRAPCNAPVSPVRPRAASVRRAATGKCVGRLVRVKLANNLQLDATACIAAISTVGNSGEYITGSAAKTADTGPVDKESTVQITAGGNGCNWQCSLPYDRNAFSIVQHIMTVESMLATCMLERWTDIVVLPEP